MSHRTLFALYDDSPKTAYIIAPGLETALEERKTSYYEKSWKMTCGQMVGEFLTIKKMRDQREDTAAEWSDYFEVDKYDTMLTVLCRTYENLGCNK